MSRPDTGIEDRLEHDADGHHREQGRQVDERSIQVGEPPDAAGEQHGECERDDGLEDDRRDGEDHRIDYRDPVF